LIGNTNTNKMQMLPVYCADYTYSDQWRMAYWSIICSCEKKCFQQVFERLIIRLLWRSEGRECQADGPANEKALSPNFSFVLGTS